MDDEQTWVRDRLADGESPGEIIDELVDADWTVDEARETVWTAVGTGLGGGDDGGCLLCKVLPVAMSGLALILSLVVAFAVFNGQVAGGIPGPVPGPNDTVSSERAFGIANGTIPAIEDGPAPMLLRVANNDQQAYTVMVGEDTHQLPVDEAITIRLETAGTYTVRLEETGDERTVTVE